MLNYNSHVIAQDNYASYLECTCTTTNSTRLCLVLYEHSCYEFLITQLIMLLLVQIAKSKSNHTVRCKFIKKKLEIKRTTYIICTYFYNVHINHLSFLNTKL